MNNVSISPRITKRVQSEARRRSISPTTFIERALKSFFDQADEEKFVRQLRRSARQKGLTSQRAVARLVENVRAGR